MIQVERVEEPASFDEEVRRRGNAWLKGNAGRRMPDYWASYRPHLAEGFRNLCGYSAMWTAPGTVDHYLSRAKHPHLAYEWSNYRFASAEMNQRKGTLDAEVLDPYEVEDGWFEIVLPSLEVVMIEERVPSLSHGRARLTLKHLANHPSVVDSRSGLYLEFLDGHLSLPYLTRKVPLLARAVKNDSSGSTPLRSTTSRPLSDASFRVRSPSPGSGGTRLASPLPSRRR